MTEYIPYAEREKQETQENDGLGTPKTERVIVNFIDSLFDSETTQVKPISSSIATSKKPKLNNDKSIKKQSNLKSRQIPPTSTKKPKIPETFIKGRRGNSAETRKKPSGLKKETNFFKGGGKAEKEKKVWGGNKILGGVVKINNNNKTMTMNKKKTDEIKGGEGGKKTKFNKAKNELSEKEKEEQRKTRLEIEKKRKNIEAKLKKIHDNIESLKKQESELNNQLLQLRKKENYINCHNRSKIILINKDEDNKNNDNNNTNEVPKIVKKSKDTEDIMFQRKFNKIDKNMKIKDKKMNRSVNVDKNKNSKNKK